MRIMAVDYGDSRTGIAISDKDGKLVGEARVIKEWNDERLAKKLNDLVSDRGVALIVLGLPINMNGSRGDRAEKSEKLSKMLTEKYGLKVVLQDERRTTIDAHRILTEVGHRGKKRKETVDAVAASLILETYLNRINPR